jgi:hypothetical protein
METTRRRGLAALFAAVLAAATLAPVTAASAAGTVYYINSASGTCSDSGAGTSIGVPWCSLTAATRTYVPGDQLLIARGSTYTGQQLTVSGQGTAAERITISTYGSGARPVISGGTAVARAGKTLVLLRNPSYVSVSGLHLTSSGAGVLAQYRTSFPGSATGNQSLAFSDLLVTLISGIGSSRVNGGTQSFDCHSNNLDLWQSGGVAVTGDYAISVPTNSYFVSGVSFTDIEGHDNLNVVNVDTCDGQVGNPGAPNGPRPHLVRDVTLNNVWAYDGNGSGYPELCNEGMRFAGVTGLRVVNSRFNNLGACHVAGGTAGVILVAVSNAVFANNIISDVPNTSSHDMTGIDNEIYVDGVQLRNNLIARNAGPGVEFLSLRAGIPDYNTNHTITGNSFYGNKDSLFRLDAAGMPFSGTIDRNLFGDVTTTSSPEVTPLLGANNVYTRTGTIPHYAADEFQAVQGFAGWKYQTTTNVASSGAWADATFSDGTHLSGVWVGGTTTGSIAPFEQTAGTCATCATARVWTAPIAGTVAIRSLAAKSIAGGAATSVRIVQNGSVVAGPTGIAASNTTGTEVNVDLTVAAGDTLRFEVSGAAAAGDWTSWAPSIAYTQAAAVSPNGTIANGSFETPALAANTFQYSPTGSWTYSPHTGTAGAGIARNGSGFSNPNATDGSQVGFIQWQGSLTQTVSGLPAGSRYTVNFDVARRGSETQTVEVLVDGVVVGSVSPATSAFVPYVSPVVSPGPGTHTVQLRGTATSDKTAFVDRVTLAPADIIPVNSGFEAPALGTGFQYAPSGGTWSFTASAGIAANGSAFQPPTTPQGTQAALLQSTSTISQSVPGFVAGQGYTVVFSAVQRPGNSQTVEVLVDGVVKATVTPGSSWATAATPIFTTATGAHDVAFRSIVSGDQTAFVDDVRILKATAASIPGASFEAPALAAGGYQYGGPVTSWLAQPSLSRGGSGIIRNGSPFGATATDGAQVGFVQRGSVLFSAAPLAAGTYILSFDTSQRVRAGVADQQQLRVQIDGMPVLTITPTATNSTVSTLVVVRPGSGGQLEFVGTIGGTDNTVFIDNLRADRVGL